jgi:hypothetical protein
MRPIAIFLAAMIATVGECVSLDHRTSPNDALQSPHEFRLVLARLYGAPGDLIPARLTFQNTGRVPLWIPKSDQLNFSYVSYDGDEVIALSASQCNGIEYVKVREDSRSRMREPLWYHMSVLGASTYMCFKRAMYECPSR